MLCQELLKVLRLRGQPQPALQAETPLDLCDSAQRDFGEGVDPGGDGNSSSQDKTTIKVKIELMYN